MAWAEKINDYVAHSRAGRYFQLAGSGARRERKNTKFLTEIRAGLTTFFAMAYIISVNAAILSDSGGTCVCESTPDDPVCDLNTEYALCVNEFRVQLIAGTAITCTIACVLFGILANLPLGLAPGMGLNAYFTYTVVGYHGTGNISYKVAMGAVFIEGFIFLLLTILGVRQWLARIIPMSIKLGMGVGIGLFLCFVGLQTSEGIGLVAPDSATLVTLGGCPADMKDETGACLGGTMESPTLWMGILGLLVMSILLLYRVRGALLLGIIFIAITSWPRVSEVTLFPYTPQGQNMFDYFKQVVKLQPLDRILAQFEFDLSTGDTWVALITFLYVDILDTTGTLYSMAKYGGYMDKHGDFERSSMAFLTDAISIIVGACFGCSPVTAYVESGAGIAEGGRTGITAITIGFGFFISIFFSPIFASFPPWACGGALVIVGSMMTSSARNINWDYPGDSIPAFITIAVMPFTYSIAYGVVGGVIAYIVINTFVWVMDKITFGRLKPDYSQREPYWEVIRGQPFLPIYMRYLIAKIRGKPFNWHEDEHEFSDDEDNDASSKSSNSNLKDDEGYPEVVTTNGGAGGHPAPEILNEKTSV
ncbi:permease family-domain-containing protein [Zychaea mexicana]|uniref:permease family-domain-containing protein n=1 Tax=Zychaea mexicana TaxID=64656 RepID=UPI0022FE8F06|nr:permease family-domain-containing protein [Zychaea mexicana]KAI9492059.1 permease family-domain-containing protein [Zychaea mexicana]